MPTEPVNTRQRIRLAAEEQAEFLRHNRKAALATIDKDGFPHLVAMTYAVGEDGGFYMTSFRKAQKVLNIQRNPRVALMIDSGGSYAELRGVMVRGFCEIIDDLDAVYDAFALIAGERPGGAARRPESIASAPKRVVLKVMPEKTVTWDHTKLGGGY
jgi:PPOX class probable F420-dependent enzyme